MKKGYLNMSLEELIDHDLIQLKVNAEFFSNREGKSKEEREEIILKYMKGIVLNLIKDHFKKEEIEKVLQEIFEKNE